MKTIYLLVLILTITGCSVLPNTPDTLAEQYTSYSYIPFDPLPVSTLPGASCSPTPIEKILKSIKKPKLRELRNSFPDQTVRIAVAEFHSNGSLSFGPATVGYEGKTYQVIVDYMNTDTATGSFLVKREVVGQEPRSNLFGTKYTYPEYKQGKPLDIFEPVPYGVLTGYEVLPNPSSDIFSSLSTSESEAIRKISSTNNEDYEVLNLPVYVGVGLRLTATIRVLNGTVALSGLPEIAGEAQAGNLSGTLVVQTLGVTGEHVSANLPLPSELNRTTIQTAIQALGAIKALIPDEKMQLTPRVVGIYNPFGGGQSLVNGIISALASKRLSWHQPCDYEFNQT